MDRSRVALIIPALNEAASIVAVVEGCSPHGQVIVVDDGSTDATAALARQAGAIVVSHGYNRGYDAALDTGFAEAARLGCSHALTLDADGQHDPARIGRFLQALEGGAVLVAGERQQLPRVGEKVFAWYTRYRYGLADPMCGMKGYHMDLYRALGHFDSYRSIGSELLLFAAARGVPIARLPLQARERNGQSRFGGSLRANYRIFRAMLLGIWHYAGASRRQGRVS